MRSLPKSLGDVAKSLGAITASRSSTFSCAASIFPSRTGLRLYARMNSERGRISMRYRSEGEEEGLKIRAIAEEEKARVLARAIELSQARRGEGDAEAARVYARAFGQAPDFYGFLRTMEASRSLVRQRTTMVLPADSPLFGLLTDSNYFNGECRRGRRRNRGRAAQEVAADTATMEEARMK